jgi:hypothetical protein
MLPVAIDVAGGSGGGAARFRQELLRYLDRNARQDVRVIGTRHHLSPAWLAAREAAAGHGTRRIALNNVGFFAPGGERWTLLRNALYFLTDAEAARLDPSLRAMAARRATLVRCAARRSDVLVAPCTAMADRIAGVLPDVAGRLVVRMHPVSGTPAPAEPGSRLILCPVLFGSYKRMPQRLAEWLAIADGLDHRVHMVVTPPPPMYRPCWRPVPG